MSRETGTSPVSPAESGQTPENSPLFKKKISRREFLELVGKSVAANALSAIVPPIPGIREGSPLAVAVEPAALTPKIAAEPLLLAGLEIDHERTEIGGVSFAILSSGEHEDQGGNTELNRKSRMANRLEWESLRAGGSPFPRIATWEDEAGQTHDIAGYDLPSTDSLSNRMIAVATRQLNSDGSWSWVLLNDNRSPATLYKADKTIAIRTSPDADHGDSNKLGKLDPNQLVSMVPTILSPEVKIPPNEQWLPVFNPAQPDYYDTPKAVWVCANYQGNKLMSPVTSEAWGKMQETFQLVELLDTKPRELGSVGKPYEFDDVTVVDGPEGVPQVLVMRGNKDGYSNAAARIASSIQTLLHVPGLKEYFETAQIRFVGNDQGYLNNKDAWAGPDYIDRGGRHWVYGVSLDPKPGYSGHGTPESQTMGALAHESARLVICGRTGRYGLTDTKSDISRVLPVEKEMVAILCDWLAKNGRSQDIQGVRYVHGINVGFARGLGID